MQSFSQLIQHHLKSLLSNIKVSPTIKWFHQSIQIYVHIYKIDYLWIPWFNCNIHVCSLYMENVYYNGLLCRRKSL
jgi:hypothetical protein